MTKAKPNIAIAPAPLKFERAPNFPNLSIADAQEYAVQVDRVQTALDKASSQKDSAAVGHRLDEAHLCANDQHLALLDLIATSQAQTLKEALTQMLVGVHFLDMLTCGMDDAPSTRSDYRKLLQIFESVTLMLEDQLNVSRADCDIYADGSGIRELRPHMQIAGA